MKLLLEVLFKELYRLLTEKRYRAFACLIVKYGTGQRYQQKKINIAGMNINVPDAKSFIWQFKEIWTDENYKFQTDSLEPVIFDCGANIGTSVLYFAQIFSNAKIIAFEPDPNIFKLLEDNVKLNEIKNVDLINKAVWINEEGIDFGIEGADGSSIYSDNNKIKVSSCRLKSLIEKENKIDLLKIDIEGAEVEVLKDCEGSLNKVDNIFIEYHSFVDRSQELELLLALLSKNGFRYFIKQEADRKLPFLNKHIKSNPVMDLQLNIFAYRNR